MSWYLVKHRDTFILLKDGGDRIT